MQTQRRVRFTVAILSLILGLGAGFWLGLIIQRAFGEPRLDSLAAKPQPATTFQAWNLGQYELQLSFPSDMAERDAAIVFLTVKNDSILTPGLKLSITAQQTENCASIPIALEQQEMPAYAQTNLFAWAVSTKEAGECIIGIRGIILYPSRKLFHLEISVARIRVHSRTDFLQALQPLLTAVLAALAAVLAALYTRQA